MEIKDVEAWQLWRNSNKDDYGGEVIRYAEAWADLMEERLELGNSIENMWEDTSHEADTNGITGFMFGAAISVLLQSWIHGEELYSFAKRYVS